MHKMKINCILKINNHTIYNQKIKYHETTSIGKKTLNNIWHCSGQRIFGFDSKSERNRREITGVRSHQTEKLLHSKGSKEPSEKSAREMRETLPKPPFGKGLPSKTCKNLDSLHIIYNYHIICSKSLNSNKVIT